uniref:Uncharacterized protein n=1 Tax=Trypanosoma congolense (strain IL3000) TaxID=1068625 RepID=G0UVC1_TRYCI|nr:conserved hypothetical protein [Trypanosoma congolense IL3000]
MAKTSHVLTQSDSHAMGSAKATRRLDICLDFLARARKAQEDSISTVSLLHRSIRLGGNPGVDSFLADEMPVNIAAETQIIDRMLVRLRITEVKLTALQPELWESAKGVVYQHFASLRGVAGIEGVTWIEGSCMAHEVEPSNKIWGILEQCDKLAQLQREAVQSLYTKLHGNVTQLNKGKLHFYDHLFDRDMLGCEQVFCGKQYDLCVGHDVRMFVEQLEDLMRCKQRVFNHLEVTLRGILGLPLHPFTYAPDGNDSADDKYPDTQCGSPADTIASVSSESTDECEFSLLTCPELCPGGSAGPSLMSGSTVAANPVDGGTLFGCGIGSLGQDGCKVGNSDGEITKEGGRTNVILDALPGWAEHQIPGDERRAAQMMECVAEDVYICSLLEANDRVISDIQEHMLSAINSCVSLSPTGDGDVSFIFPSSSLNPERPTVMKNLSHCSGDANVVEHSATGGDTARTLGNIIRDKLNELIEISFKLRANFIMLNEEKHRWRQVAEGFQEENMLWMAKEVEMREFCSVSEGSKRITLHDQRGKGTSDVNPSSTSIEVEAVCCDVKSKSCGYVMDRATEALQASDAALTVGCTAVQPSTSVGVAPRNIATASLERGSSKTFTGDEEGNERRIQQRLHSSTMLQSGEIHSMEPPLRRSLKYNDTRIKPRTPRSRWVQTECSLSPPSPLNTGDGGKSCENNYDRSEDVEAGSRKPAEGGLVVASAGQHVAETLTKAGECLTNSEDVGADQDESPSSGLISHSFLQPAWSPPHATGNLSDVTSPICVHEDPLPAIAQEKKRDHADECMSDKGCDAPAETCAFPETPGNNAAVDVSLNVGETNCELLSFSPSVSPNRIFSETTMPEFGLVMNAPEPQPAISRELMLRELRERLVLLQSSHSRTVRQKNILQLKRRRGTVLLQLECVNGTTGAGTSELKGQSVQLLARMDSVQRNMSKRESDLGNSVDASEQYTTQMERNVLPVE